MQSDNPDNSSEVRTAERVTTARSDAYRERFRKAQLVAAQVARARAAGGPPSDEEAGRLVAQFHARGGQVITCPPAAEEPHVQLRRRSA